MAGSTAKEFMARRDLVHEVMHQEFGSVYVLPRSISRREWSESEDGDWVGASNQQLQISVQTAESIVAIAVCNDGRELG